MSELGAASLGAEVELDVRGARAARGRRDQLGASKRERSELTRQRSAVAHAGEYALHCIVLAPIERISELISVQVVSPLAHLVN